MELNFPVWPHASRVVEGDVVRRYKKQYSESFSVSYLLFLGRVVEDDTIILTFYELTENNSYGTYSYTLTRRVTTATHDDLTKLTQASRDDARSALAAALRASQIRVLEAETVFKRAISDGEALDRVADMIGEELADERWL